MILLLAKQFKYIFLILQLSIFYVMFIYPFWKTNIRVLGEKRQERPV